MDEKRTGSSPSNETNEYRDESISADGTVDVPTPDGTADRGFTFVTQTHYDPAEPRDLTTVIIGAIADAEDVPIVDVKHPPLYDVVDIACIDAALFGRTDVDRDGTESAVEFRYNEYRVRVGADGWVTVYTRSVGQTGKEE